MSQRVKNLSAMWETHVLSLGQQDPLKKEMAPTPVFLPGEFHEQRSLMATVHGLKRFGHDLGLPWWLRGLSVCLQCGRPGFDPWVRKIPWRRIWEPNPVFLPGESHGLRSLVGRKESDTTELLHFT